MNRSSDRPIAMYSDHETCGGGGCFICDGTGQICDVCGEPPTVCACPTGNEENNERVSAEGEGR